MVVSGKVIGGGGEGIAAKLAAYTQHQTAVSVLVLLGFLECFSALVLAVTLWAITRDEDQEVAMMGLVCRVGEGVAGIGKPTSISLLWLATASSTNTVDSVAAHSIAAFLVKLGGWDTLISATLFAVGSTCFSWLLLRGRMIPVALAWVGVVASVLLVVGLPLQLAGFLRGTITSLMWIPMAGFEIPLGVWLLVKGVAGASAQSPAQNAATLQ